MSNSPNSRLRLLSLSSSLSFLSYALIDLFWPCLIVHMVCVAWMAWMALLMQVSFKFQSSVSPTRYLIVAAKDYFERRGRSHTGGYMGWLTCGIWCLAKNCCWVWVKCASALWWIFLAPDCHVILCLWRYASQGLLRISNKNAGYRVALQTVRTVYNTVLIEKSDKYHLYLVTGVAVAQLVEALRYKAEGRGFESRWCHGIFSLT